MRKGKRKSDKTQPDISKFLSKDGTSGSKIAKSSSNDTVYQYCLSLSNNNSETLEKLEEGQTEIETENSVNPEQAKSQVTATG